MCVVRKAGILTGVGQIRVTVAVPGVVHDHARGLHEGIANGRPNECETGFFQRAAHGFGFGRDGRHFAAVPEMIDLGHAADKRPEQTHRVLQRQPGGGVAPGRVELQAIAHDAWVQHQRVDLVIAQPRQALRIKAEQDLSIMLALA